MTNEKNTLFVNNTATQKEILLKRERILRKNLDEIKFCFTFVSVFS